MADDFYAQVIPYLVGAALAPLLLVRAWDLVREIIGG